MARIVATTYKQLLDARNTSFKLARALQALSDGTLAHGSTMSAQSAAHVDALILQHSNSMYVDGLFADKAATLGLNFWSNVYFTRSSSFGVMQDANFEDLVTLTRATAGGCINELGVYTLVPADTPRLSHDPNSVVLSTSVVDLITEVPTFVLGTHTFLVGDKFRATANVGYICGVVLSTTVSSVTIQAQHVVGVGVGSSWTCIKPLGLLVEEQRTNLLLRSTIEGGTAGTVGSGAVAPTGWSFPFTGGTVAFPISALGTISIATTKTVTTDRPFIQQSISVLASTSYVLSTRVTSSSGTMKLGDLCAWASLPAGATQAYYKNGVLTTASAIEVLVYGDVISSVLTVSTTAGTAQARVGLGSAGDTSVTGSCSLTMPMIEQAATSGSYIPTTTAQVTRAADSAAVNTLSPWYNQLEGTLVAEAIPSTSSPTANTPLVLFDGPGTNLIRLRFEPTSSYFESVKNGSAVVGLGANRSIVARQLFKTAASFKDAAYAISYNGSAPVTGSGVAGALPVVSSLLIGHHPYNSNRFNGIISSITYYPRVIDVQQASA